MDLALRLILDFYSQVLAAEQKIAELQREIDRLSPGEGSTGDS